MTAKGSSAALNRISVMTGKGGSAEEAPQTAQEEEPDLISRLPDCVLGAVVSLLGTEDGARTAILARRWRHVWRSAPLNLDDPLYPIIVEGQRAQLISQILAAHPGPARRVAFRSLPLRNNIAHYEAWFRLPLLDTLQELVLHSPFLHDELPASALRFTSLRVLDVKQCVFPVGCGSPAFPCLTHLSLQEVDISEELLQGMISRSPGIEAMVLDTNSGHSRLRLSLPRLRCMAVLVRNFVRSDHRVELHHLVLEDAACLERLLLHQVTYGPTVRITGATRLKTLGYLGTAFPIVELGNSIFKGMVPARLVENFSTVKILALALREPDLKLVTGTLSCFPCLEKLHVKFRNKWTRLGGSGLDVPSTPIMCLDRTLKTIVLRPYGGMKPQLEFAKFFVERARVLELMKFGDCEECSTTWTQDQRRELHTEMRASRCAQFCFVPDGMLPPTCWMGEGFSRDVPF